MMMTSSRETFEDYQDPYIRQTVRTLPNIIESGLRDFLAPYPYLLKYASAVAQTELKPVATAVLPSAYGKDPKGALQRHIAFVRAHTVDITIRTEIANATASGIMVKYKGTKDGKDIVVLAGVDYEGVEYYDANNGKMLANVTALLDNVNCTFDKNGVLVDPAGWTPGQK